MTANQIAYQRQQEEERSHRETERLGRAQVLETRRSNQEQERLKQQLNVITADYNRQQVLLERARIAEQRRHAKEAELQARRQLVHAQDEQRIQRETSTFLQRRQQDIQTDYNRQLAAVQSGQLREQQRSNLANEMLRNLANQESMRHNSASEALTARQQSMNFDVSRLDRSSRERIAAAGNATSTTNTILSGFFRLAGTGGSSLAKLITRR